MIEWLQFIYAICTAGDSPSNWREIAFTANLAVALAYFWIPAVMAVVFARWREELPYGWLWVGFVVFITACGLSHVVHAFHALQDQTPHTRIELAIMVITAIVSLATAAGFTYLLPKILKLASPAEGRKRLEAAVSTATADLQRALEHERLLLLEVHHRVKNNLQVTASLVNLHIKRSSTGPVHELKSLRDRIMAMATVHGQLQQVGAATLKARGFIDALAASLTDKGADRGVTVEVDGPDFDVPLDHAVSFALILHEVVANALGHGFPVGRTGRIRVTLGRDGDRRSVSVSDDGVGMASDAPDGIGGTLITTLAVQLGARVHWERPPEGGTVFRMEYDEQVPQERLRGVGLAPA